MRIAVAGAGSWGTTLAVHLSGLGHEVALWVYETDLYERMLKDRVNVTYLPEVRVDPAVRLERELDAAVRGCETVLLAVPSHVYRDILVSLRGWLPAGAILISATKGIENDSLMIMSEVVRSVLGEARYAVLSGPSFAKEVAMGHPTAVTVASQDMALATRLQNEFSSDRFRVYAHNDVVGTELGGAVKNVIAIAAGISDGLGFGLNARAALVTRGLSEMMRLGIRMGANPMTFGGLSGIGDLILTCTGDLSRNRRVGLRVAKGEHVEEICRSMVAIAEGVRTTKSVKDLANKHRVEMPITEEVYRVLYEEKDPGAAVDDLMTRPLKREILSGPG
jgi:glycerol-3-phosphate dehydrogenase (NAD(P)+)